METVKHRCVDHLAIQVNRQHYVVPVPEVRDVLPALPPIRPPHAPSVLEGLSNLGACIIPVLDLRFHLEVPLHPRRSSDHIVEMSTGRCDVAETSELADLARQAPRQ